MSVSAKRQIAQLKEIFMRRTLEAIVESKSSAKTVRVVVKRTVRHPKYKKRYSVTKRYLVHDPKETAKPGDAVVIRETRPISKQKHWVISNNRTK
jgi:small subunit ribosomal protein S17